MRKYSCGYMYTRIYGSKKIYVKFLSIIITMLLVTGKKKIKSPIVIWDALLNPIKFFGPSADVSKKRL